MNMFVHGYRIPTGITPAKSLQCQQHDVHGLQDAARGILASAQRMHRHSTAVVQIILQILGQPGRKQPSGCRSQARSVTACSHVIAATVMMSFSRRQPQPALAVPLLW